MLTRESGYRRTMTACFLGYIVQATICTLAPLLYARFQTEYQIPLGRISLMITLTFAIQLLVDLASSFFVDRIGYRRCIVAAWCMCWLQWAQPGKCCPHKAKLWKRLPKW